MSVLEGFLLGLLQGVSEFLPISSSGHLKLAQKLFGLSEVPLLYDVFLHLATLLAVIVFFRKKIWTLLCTFVNLFRKKNNAEQSDETQILKQKNDRAYLLAIIIATFITGVIGICTSKLLDEDLFPLKLVCAGFIVTAVFLILSSFVEKINSRKNFQSEEVQEKPIKWYQALVIGFAQGLGTLPGISRSGSTIAGGLFCGVNRETAGEFSFIVSIPAILGAFILELKDLGEVSSAVGVWSVVAGCLSAFVSGYLALMLLMKLIKKGHLEWFAVYLIPLGIAGLFVF